MHIIRVERRNHNLLSNTDYERRSSEHQLTGHGHIYGEGGRHSLIIL